MNFAKDNRFKSGSVESFDASWRGLEDRDRYHFVRGQPLNQVQFAFQNHWRVFRKLIGSPLRSALEVGCGRGSMAAYFAAAGYTTHLLDSSPEAIQLAQRNFAADGLAGNFVVADALDLPFSDGSMDVILSVGLLEHFEDISKPLAEQIRVLRTGGVFLGYVVPEHATSVQLLANPVNAALRLAKSCSSGEPQAAPKARLYRNGLKSAAFLDALRTLRVREMGAFGMFPLPLISHSPSFPFTPLSANAERRLVAFWKRLLALRPRTNFSSTDPLQDPWVCPEAWGLAFLVWARK
jgi:SAM-dependent methyltransferase